MTAFERARGWFVAPPPPDAGDEARWYAPPAGERPHESDDGGAREAGASPGAHSPDPRARWQPPVPGDRPGEPERAAAATVTSADALDERGKVEPAAVTSAAVPGRRGEAQSVDVTSAALLGPRGEAEPVDVTPAAALGPHGEAEPVDVTPAAALGPHGEADPVDVTPAAVLGPHGEADPVDVTPAAALGPHVQAEAAAVTSAAVLGRPGEVEPVAAALALALRRETRSKAATVAMIGASLPDAAEGGGAARRLAARLEDHGLEARVRGRLAWVRLDPEDPRLASTARRVTLVAAPAVLAVTAPRTAATDAALAEHDLLVLVAAEPDGPLAQLAAAGLHIRGGPPVVAIRPLGRGPGRALARAGLKPAPTVRRLLEEQRR